jgi:hypothetical protein
LGTPVQACPQKQGGIWVQVNNDLGTGVGGVSVSVNGIPKTTDGVGFASWDPLSPQACAVKVEPLTGRLPEDYDLPVKSSTGATVKDGEIAFVTFILPRKQPAVKENPELTWIEIAMVGEDNSPIAGIKYRVKLPNSQTVEGVLNAAGKARIDNIPGEGDCEVTFPALDREAWSEL